MKKKKKKIFKINSIDPIAWMICKIFLTGCALSTTQKWLNKKAMISRKKYFEQTRHHHHTHNTEQLSYGAVPPHCRQKLLFDLSKMIMEFMILNLLATRYRSLLFELLWTWKYVYQNQKKSLYGLESIKLQQNCYKQLTTVIVHIPRMRNNTCCAALMNMVLENSLNFECTILVYTATTTTKKRFN